MPDTMITSSTSASPWSFASAVIDAVKPFVAEDTENIREDVMRKDIYLAVLPFFTDYVLADAVPAHAMFRAVRDSLSTDDDAGRTAYTATCSVLEILEDFICSAYRSGPDCVAAMAHFATLTMDDTTDEPVPGPENFTRLLQNIGRGIGELRAGDFTMGEKFGTKDRASWLFRVTPSNELHQLAGVLTESALAAAE